MDHGQSQFGTVLVARKSSDQPNELELKLRQWSQRVRVVTQLTGGAHFLLPGSEATIAVRAYGPNTIVHMQKQLEDTEQNCVWAKQYLAQLHGTDMLRQGCGASNGSDAKFSKEQSTDKRQPCRGEEEISSGNCAGDDIGDVDGLRGFCCSLKHPVVFFILPPGELQREQLSRGDSFVNKAQLALTTANRTKQRKEMSPQDPKHGDTNNAVATPSTARIYIVPDVVSVLRTLVSVSDSSKSERQALKQKFFEKQASKCFLPDPNTGLPPSEAAVASHVAGAFRAWANRFDLPPGDAGVFLSVLGTLANITSADESVLDAVPIDDSSKEILMHFFGSSSNREGRTNYVEPNESGPYEAAPVSSQQTHTLTSVPTGLVQQGENETEFHSGQLTHQTTSLAMSQHFPSGVSSTMEGVGATMPGARATTGIEEMPQLHGYDGPQQNLSYAHTSSTFTAGVRSVHNLDSSSMLLQQNIVVGRHIHPHMQHSQGGSGDQVHVFGRSDTYCVGDTVLGSSHPYHRTQGNYIQF